jgi:hypothetical protein
MQASTAPARATTAMNPTTVAPPTTTVVGIAMSMDRGTTYVDAGHDARDGGERLYPGARPPDRLTDSAPGVILDPDTSPSAEVAAS